MDEVSINDRLRSLRTRAGYSVRSFAIALGLGERFTTYANYESKFKGPDLKVAMVEKMAPLLVGRGDPPITAEEVWSLAGIGNKSSSLPSTLVSKVAATAHIDPQDIITVPEYEFSRIRLKAKKTGNGEQWLDHLVPDTSWFLPKAMMKSYARDVLQLCFTRVNDASMMPRFVMGDPILIDRGQDKIDKDGLYLLWDGLSCLFKQVQRLPRSNPAAVRLKSLNPDYSPEEVETSAIDVVGRVVAHWNWT